VPIVTKLIMLNGIEPFHRASASITTVGQNPSPKNTGRMKHMIVMTDPSETGFPNGRKRPP